jgi:subtilisin family serine protease
MTRSRRVISLAIVSAFVLGISPITVPAIVDAATTTSISPALPTPSTTPPLSPVFRSGDSPLAGEKRYIVRYLDNESNDSVNDELSKSNGRLKGRLSKVFNGAIADMTPGKAAQLRKSAKVLWVEEDKGVATQTTVSPTRSWGLDRIDQRTNTPTNSYSFTTNGAGVLVYVIDTGILSTHSEFAGRTRAGFDAFGGNSTDCNGHGTHVAGTVAGANYGVAPAASLVSVRVLDCAGAGSVSGVISGIDWVINDHVSGPAVINMSLGAGKSASLESAVDRAFNDGITVVSAAGNSNVDACTSSPGGNKASGLTVGATTTTDARASYSNFGACLDMFAPGSGIVSAGISSTTAIATMSGTSMAAPHVAGLAARFLSAVTTASPAQVMNSLITSSTANVVTSPGTLSPNRLAYGDPSLTPTSSTTTSAPGSTTLPPGSGTEAQPSIPGAPGTPVALAGATSAWLNWTAAATGGSPITGHVVRIYRKKSLVGQVVVDADNYHTISGLTAGSSTYFTVAAMNGVGAGPFSSPSNTIIPLRNSGTFVKSQSANATDIIPEAPTKVLTSQVKSSLNILWTPPTNAVASSYETVFYQNKKIVAKVVTVASGGIRVFGLKKGVYSVRVRATNVTGTGKLSRPLRIVVR